MILRVVKVGLLYACGTCDNLMSLFSSEEMITALFASDPDLENVDLKYPDPVSGGTYTSGHSLFQRLRYQTTPS